MGEFVSWIGLQINIIIAQLYWDHFSCSKLISDVLEQPFNFHALCVAAYWCVKARACVIGEVLRSSHCESRWGESEVFDVIRV